MKKVISVICLCFSFLSLNAQDQITNSGNLRLHYGANMTVFGNFKQDGALALASGTVLTNNGVFSYIGSLSSSGTFVYGDTGSLIYSGSSQQTSGSELPDVNGPVEVIIDNTAGVVLSDNASLIDLTLSNGKLFVGSHTLTIGGAFAGSATNSLSLNGQSNLITASATGTLFFDQTADSCHTAGNYTITAGTATLGNSLFIKGIVTHTAGTLNTGGNLALLATDSVTYGQVAGTGSGTISGGMSMQMILPGTTSGWRNFCSPFDATTLNDLGSQTTINLTNTAPSGDNRNVYRWTESSKTWSFVTADEVMYTKGYSIYFFNPSNSTIELSGTYSRSDMNLGLLTFVNSSNANEDGWHLMANPYPSGINWNSVTLPANMNNQYAIWSTHDGNYRPWNGTAGSAGQYIPPMHAFWVKVTATTSADFIITSSNRSTNTQNHFRKNDVLTNGLILDVAAPSGTFKDQVIVYFDQTKLENEEKGAYKLAGDAQAPQLWSLRSGNRYSIDVYGPEINENFVVPLGFKTSIPGSYSLEPRFENWVPGMEAWLEDTKTAQWHDLFSGPYLFDHLSGDTSSARFNLHYKGRPSSSQIAKTPEIPLIVYTDGDAIKVKITGEPNEGNVSITVWNMLGQSVYHHVFQGGNEFSLSPNTANGMYLVEVRTEKVTRTVKILR